MESAWFTGLDAALGWVETSPVGAFLRVWFATLDVG